MTVLSIDRKVDALGLIVKEAEERDRQRQAQLIAIKADALSDFLGVANCAEKWGKVDYVIPVLMEALVKAAERYRDKMDQWWKEAL